MLSNKPAMDRFDMAAMASRGKMPRESTVMATYNPSAITMPNTVAKPTSLFFLACAESTDAPSNPVNTQSVINMVFFTCSPTLWLSDVPAISCVKVCGEKK